MQIRGKLHEKQETKQVTASFRKREFVVEYLENPMYPQFIAFQLSQDKCALLDPYSLGTMLDVDFNLRGREWVSPQGEKKYFNSLEAWRITQVANQGGQESAPIPIPPPDAINIASLGDDDDLPF